MICKDCNHDLHDPGECKFDNCGSSEISHSDATELDDESQVVTLENFNRAEVSVRLIKRIQPRVTLDD